MLVWYELNQKSANPALEKSFAKKKVINGIYVFYKHFQRLVRDKYIE